MTQYSRKKYTPTGMQNKISLQIRRDIRKGLYKPGEKLPLRTEFEKHYKTQPVTIQKAFDKLKEDGFIITKGKLGTFVADNPPCFTNYAIVITFHFSKKNQELSFYRILIALAKKRFKKSNLSFTIYTGVTGHKDEPDYIRLYDDVKAERLAGIIFAASPHLIEDTPLFKEIISMKYLPKVAFMSQNAFPEIPAVTYCFSEAMKIIFDFLESKNIKRLAVVSALSEDTYKSKLPDESKIFAEAKKRGIALPRCDFQIRYSRFAFRTKELVESIFNREKGMRAEALWIMTDTITEYATKGILDSGLKVPDDLIVISHCNFPEKPKTCVDTSWYGLNVYTFIDTALDIMRKQYNGELVPILNSIPVECYFK